MKKKRTLLDEKIEEHKDALYRLSQIRDIIISLILLNLLFSFFFYLWLLQDIISKGMSFIRGLNLVYPPLMILIGLIGIRYSISFIRHYKKELQIAKKEREAELKVQDFLKKSLTADYHIFENVYFGYGDIDVVIIGPSGIFVIEVKSNSGIITLNNQGYLSITNGEVPKKNYRRQVISEANMLKKYFDNQLGLKSFVLPVIVFPFADVMRDIFLEDKDDNYKVPVLNEKNLLEFIYTNKQNSLAKEAIGRYSSILCESQKEYSEIIE